MKWKCYFFVATVLVSMVTSDFDYDFCYRRMGAYINGSTNGATPPVFYDNLYVFIEQKVITNHTVNNIEEYYSQKAGMFYVYSASPTRVSQIWVDTNSDELLMGQDVCTDSPLEGSDLAKLLGVIEDNNGQLHLNTPDVAFGWDKNLWKASAFIGSDNVRGIQSSKWWICAYNTQLDLTTFTEWHITDGSQSWLPLVTTKQENKPVLPMMAIIEGISNSSESGFVQFTYRYDLTFYDNIQAHDPVFQIPVNMLCVAKPSAQKPLPVLPSFFTFKGEQITIKNPFGAIRNPASLLYTVEEYAHTLSIFIQDLLYTSDQFSLVNDKSYIRNVHDYSVGISYNLDLISGTCEVTVIDSNNNPDTLPVAGGLVQMRNAQQFFDLDSNQYQYMGNHTMRSIDCDAWSAYFDDGKSYHIQKALYTWYFATSAWMKENGFHNYTAPLPIALEITSDGQYILFNFYEFSSQDSIVVPDISSCFSVSDIINVELLISGRFDQVVSPNYDRFGQVFFATMIEQTNLVSPLRLADVDIAPADNNETIIRFKLLDFSDIKIKGDVANPLKASPNSAVFNSLKTSVDSGKFAINIGSYFSSSDILGASVFVYGKPGSVSKITSGSSGSSGYSGGAMAGMALGMLLLGLIIGLVVIITVKKFRRQNSNNDLGMNVLGKIQS